MKKVSMIIIFFTIIFGALGITHNAKALSLKNTNNSNWEKISVGSWGPDASYIPYNIEPGATENWDRSDDRGDLVVDHNNNKTYYVSSGFSGYLQGDTFLRSDNDGLVVKPIDTNVPSGSNDVIVVKNQGGIANLSISISRWRDEDSGDYFTIPAGSSMVWARSDSRGYIMNIKETGESFYIKSGVEVDFSNSVFYPTISGQRIPQIAMNH